MKTTWIPNRKVLSGAIAGSITWAAFQLFNLQLPDEISVAVGGLVVSIVAYFVPLPPE